MSPGRKRRTSVKPSGTRSSGIKRSKASQDAAHDEINTQEWLGFDINKQEEWFKSIAYKYGGCHLTWKLPKESLEKEELEKTVERLQKDLEEEPNVRCFQIKNLIGCCYFKLGQNLRDNGKNDEAKNFFDKAKTEFDEILSQSNDKNCNSLKNRAFCALEDKDTKKLKNIEDQVEKLYSDNNSQESINARQAEALSEKSSCYGTFDQHMKQDCTLGIRIRREALKLGGEHWEKQDPYCYYESRFGLAFDLARLDNKCVYEKNDTDMYFEQAAKIFYDLTKIEIAKDNPHLEDIQVLQSKAWAFLADLGNRREKTRSLKNTLGLKEDLEAKDCLISALSSGIKSVVVKGLVAEQYRRSGKFDIALKLFNESLPDGKNRRWWNIHRRGKVYLDRYQKYKNEKYSASEPKDTASQQEENTRDLQMAKEDFEMCEKIRDNIPYVLLDLGYVNYYQGEYDEALRLCHKYMDSVEKLEHQDIDTAINQITKLYDMCCRGKAEAGLQNQSDSSSTKSTAGPVVKLLYEKSSLEWVEKEMQFMKKMNPEKASNLESVEVDSHHVNVENLLDSHFSHGGSTSTKSVLILTNDFVQYGWFNKMIKSEYIRKKRENHCLLLILHKTSEEVIKNRIPPELQVLCEKSDNNEHRISLSELLTLPTTSTKRCVLLVGDEWGTSKGGVSTMNQCLAEILSEGNFIVYSTALSATEEEIKEAKYKNVTLVTPKQDQSGVPILSWLESLPGVYFPKLLDIARMVDVVIGHSLVLAKASIKVYEIIREKNPNTKLYMFNHVISDIEIFKDKSAPMKMEDKEDKMVEAAKQADVLFSVGPLIFYKQQQLFNSFDDEKTHEIFLPKPVNMFFEKEWKGIDDSGASQSVVSYGRVSEVFKLKGYDIAGKAMGLVAESFASVERRSPIWEVRGISEENWKEQTKELEQAIRSRYVWAKALVYTNQKKVIEHLLRCHLVLLTSRLEPFGLVALEAMALGIPVLINEHSGLAEFIMNDEELGVFASHCIVKGTSLNDVDNFLDKDAELWATQIKRILLNMPVAKIIARQLRDALKKSKSIKESHEKFLNMCRSPPK